RLLDRLQLSEEGVMVRLGHVAGAAAPSDHGVLFLRFVPGAALHVAVLVGLEVAGAQDDGSWEERLSDGGDALAELIDELPLPSLLDEGAGMLLDVRGEQELDAHE